MKDDSSDKVALIGLFSMLVGVVIQVITNKMQSVELTKDVEQTLYFVFIFGFALMVVGFLLLIAGLFTTKTKNQSIGIALIDFYVHMAVGLYLLLAGLFTMKAGK